MSDSLSLNTELCKHFRKATTIMSRVTKKAMTNIKLSKHTKIQVYRAQHHDSLVQFCSKFWTLHAQQERKLDAFHKHRLRHILQITWQGKVTNNSILERARVPNMCTLCLSRDKYAGLGLWYKQTTVGSPWISSTDRALV